MWEIVSILYNTNFLHARNIPVNFARIFGILTGNIFPVKNTAITMHIKQSYFNNSER